MVKLLSSDQQLIEVEGDVAKYFGFIRTMIEDYGFYAEQFHF